MTCCKAFIGDHDNSLYSLGRSINGPEKHPEATSSEAGSYFETASVHHSEADRMG